MTNSSTRWLLVAAALLGLALLLPVVSAHGGLGVFNPTDDTARDVSPRSDNHHVPMIDDRSAVTDGDRSGHGPTDRGHHHGPWMNETHSGEWANGTYSGEWTNETYGPHGPWVNESQADDAWTDDTDGSNTRNGGHHRGPGGCR